jgi:hypothetical protein
MERGAIMDDKTNNAYNKVKLVAVIGFCVGVLATDRYSRWMNKRTLAKIEWQVVENERYTDSEKQAARETLCSVKGVML